MEPRVILTANLLLIRLADFDGTFGVLIHIQPYLHIYVV